MFRPHFLIPVLMLVPLGCSHQPGERLDLDRDPGQVIPSHHPEVAAGLAPDSVTRESRLELIDLLRLAELNNPELQAAMSASRAGRGATLQEGLWPNPRLQYRESDLGIDPWSWDAGRSTVSVTQPLVPSGRLGRGVAVARAREAVLELEVHETRHRIYGEVHQSWVRTVYLGDALDLQFELQQLAMETGGLVHDRQGELGLTDAEVARVTFEERNLAQDVLTIVTARTNEVERLIAQVGGIPLTPTNITGELLTLLPAAEAAIVRRETVERHPEWRAAQWRVEAARRDLELARRQAWPDPEISVGVGNNRETGENMMEAGVMIPLPLFDRNQGRIAQAREVVQQMEQQLLEVETRLTSRLGALLQLLSEVDTLATVYNDDLVPQAWEIFEATRKDFTEGNARVVDLIDAQRLYADTRQRALEFRYDLNRYLAEFRHLNLYPADVIGNQ